MTKYLKETKNCIMSTKNLNLISPKERYEFWENIKFNKTKIQE